jgi:hypothetical protein
MNAHRAVTKCHGNIIQPEITVYSMVFGTGHLVNARYIWQCKIYYMESFSNRLH